MDERLRVMGTGAALRVALAQVESGSHASARVRLGSARSHPTVCFGTV